MFLSDLPSLRGIQPRKFGLVSWSAHVPFAYDLVAALRPRLLVELGTHSGESYFAFCQSVQENATGTTSYAVDTWKGDEQSGGYGEDVYEEVSAHNAAHYSAFSYLVRALFDEAVVQFADDSIDLLHIDGLHTYGAVRHDFETWLPKVRPGGLILFHDIAARHGDFGAWQLWNEITTAPGAGRSFTFAHGWGLGVYQKPIPPGALAEALPPGLDAPLLQALFSSDEATAAALRRYYALVAENLRLRHVAGVLDAVANREVGQFALVPTRPPQPPGGESLVTFQIFFPDPEKGYAEENSRRLNLRTDRSWAKLAIPVPESFANGFIRIDPLDCPGLVDIAGVRLRSSIIEEDVWASRTRADLENMQVQGDSLVIPHRRFLRIFSTGSDPHFYLPHIDLGKYRATDEPLVLEIFLRAHTLWSTLNEAAARWLAALQDPPAAEVSAEREAELARQKEEIARLHSQFRVIRVDNVEALSQARAELVAVQAHVLSAVDLAESERQRRTEAEREAGDLRRQLEKTTRQLRKADEELAETLRDRTDAWRALQATNDALAAVREQSGQLGAERTQYRRELEAVRAETADMRAQLKAARIAQTRAENELGVDRGRVRSMQSSLSWKLTLPLRALGRALPALPGRAGRNGHQGEGEDETVPLHVDFGRSVEYQMQLDSPKDWNLDRRRVRVSGWCVPPAGQGLITGVRVVCQGKATGGRYGFPRPDVAGAIGLKDGRENCGFDVDVELPAGQSWVALEMRDETAQWHRVQEFQARTPAGFALLPRSEPRVVDTSSTLGIDTPADWNLSSKSVRLAGWCLPPAGGKITAIRAVVGSRIALGQHGYRRPDVAELLKLPPGREKCGFEIFIDVPGGKSLLKIEVCDENKKWHVVGRFPVKAPLIAKAAPRVEADSITDYPTWVGYFDTFTPSLRRWVKARSDALSYKPLISVVMPVYNTPERYLIKAIESVRDQVYDNWELCIADDASKQPHVRKVLDGFAKKDPRIKVRYREENGHISAASNTALELANGPFVALLDHDDELAPAALYAVADELNAHPDTDLLYSDEDKIDPQGRRYGPYFKPDWNPDLLHAQNYLCHLLVLRTEFFRSLGGLRVGFEGSQDWDLILRATEKLAPERIRHIPRILYHWRAIAGSTAQMAEAKDYVDRTSRRALEEHFERTGRKVEIVGTVEGYWRARHQLPYPPPLVSIIIPTRNQVGLLRQCIDGILGDRTFPHYEIIVIDNGSDDPETLDYLARLPELDQRCRSVPYHKPFNYSAINNFAVREHAKGDLVLLLNNDMEIITKGWLEELASQAARPEIGCVGAMLYYPDNRIQHAGVVLGTGGVAGHAFKYFRRGDGGHGSRARLVQNYSAVTAACLMIKRSVFLEVGGLDEENLTVAFNDVDFCLKVLKAGYRNLWTPFAELYHHESASRGLETTPEKVERFGQEIETMRARWEALLQNDPAYNPNLTLKREDFSFASPPRMSKTWGDTAG